MTLLALTLLAAAAGAGLNPLPLLALLIPGLLVVGSSREQRRTYQVSEQQIATIYLRQGKLVLRRVKGKA